jgi:NAD+ synthase (glutamine-hydrolysing)
MIFNGCEYLKYCIGSDLLFRCVQFPDFIIHAEICEDLWVPIPPSTYGAMAGATVLVNLSASNITVAKVSFACL